MKVDVKWDVLKERVEGCMVEWREKGMIEREEILIDRIGIRFKEGEWGSYREVYMHRDMVDNWGRIMVGMVFSY